MSGLFDKGGHLSPETLRKLQNGWLDEDGLLNAAGHIGGCPKCAGALATFLEDGGTAMAPSGFTQEVRGRLAARKEAGYSLVFYSLRVAAAVCAALVIVFSGTLSAIAGSTTLSKAVPAPNLGFVNRLTLNLRDFSQDVVTLIDAKDSGSFHTSQSK
jgi:hypothetical protein